MTVRPFGRLPDGEQVDLYSITGPAIALHAIAYGRIITSLEVPDRSGRSGNVVLGCPDQQSYLSNPPYLGALAGRYANRIAHGRFVLDGVEHELVRNEGLPRGPHAGLCHETQHYPDSPPHAHFPSVELRLTERYRSITRWDFAAG